MKMDPLLLLLPTTYMFVAAATATLYCTLHVDLLRSYSRFISREPFCPDSSVD